MLPENAESIETDASSWTALVNANSLVRTTGGTLGAYCLSFRATAVGDCQVGIAARVPVTPGAEYVAFASVFPPGVGAQSRIEVRWYTAGGTVISTLQGALTTAVAGGGWHQIPAMGVAPAGAVTALVVLRVTGTAVNQAWFADRVFLGRTPAVSLGNLFPWNTENLEINRSGWGAETNCLLGVSQAAASWYQSLLLTSSAAGDCLARSVVAEAPAVVQGKEYVAVAMVSPDVADLTFRIQIQWRDAAGTEIAASTAPFTPPSGQWTRCTVVATAPTGAVTARVGLAPTATAAGQKWAIDRIVLAPTSAVTTAGNLIPYNTADFEQDISGWTVTGATATQSREQVASGGYSLKMVATGGDIVATIAVPVTGFSVGEGYEFRPTVYRSAGVSRPYTTRVEWLDLTFEVIRTRWQSWGGTTEAWLSSPLGDLAPPGSVVARISFVVEGATAGETWYVDRIHFGPGGLTAVATPAAGGGAAVALRGLSTGGPTWTWSLWRVVEGSPQQPVRGWSGDTLNMPTAGDVALVVDYEAPMGVPVQYLVRTTAPSGSAGRFSYMSDPIVLDAETLDVWFKDPRLPARNTTATVRTLPSWTRAARQGSNTVYGRSRPVVISDVRSSRTGSLAVTTASQEERDALWWVLDTGGTLLLQWPPGWAQHDMYVAVGEVTEEHITALAEHHDRTWTIELTEVDRPIGGIVGSPDRTWETVLLAGSDWSEALEGAAYWIDVLTGVQ
ncbi:hypothetical protein ACIP88_05000 [Streptomyces uncialis]|uniref:hypothetical protein n=1 Tax=Streptomyces uncialis TaxID=1048205 RepID=UPI00380750E7